jgi:hypothetical protein
MKVGILTTLELGDVTRVWSLIVLGLQVELQQCYSSESLIIIV